MEINAEQIDLVSRQLATLRRPDLEICLLDPYHNLDSILSLRKKTWSVQNIDALLAQAISDQDHYDFSAIHLGVKHGDKLVATGRLTIHHTSTDLVYQFAYPDIEIPKREKYACISKLVVSPDYSNCGIATLLDDTRLNLAKKCGAEAVIALPVASRVDGFYRRGFYSLGSSTPSPKVLNRSFPVLFLDLKNREIAPRAVFLS